MERSFSLEVIRIETSAQAEEALRAIEATPAGIEIMKEKAVFRVVRVEGLNTKVANIVKQTFLSKGSDAAVSKHTIDLSHEVTDVLLFATLAQYREAIHSLERQPWGLKNLAKSLQDMLFAKN